MEDLGTILRRLRANLQTVDGVDGDEPEPKCPECGGMGFIRHDIPPTHPDFGGAFPCPACVEQRRKEHLERLSEERRAAFPKHLRRYTFAALKARTDLDNEQMKWWMMAVDLMQLYAKGHTERPEKPWILLAGPPGWGKTHLALAVCNERIDHPEYGPPALFATAPDILAGLRAGFTDDSYEPMMQEYREAPLLVIDDIGKEKETEWVSQEWFRLIDHRYRMRLPTIFTTQEELKGLDNWLADRLMDERDCLSLTAALPSYRSGLVWRSKPQ